MIRYGKRKIVSLARIIVNRYDRHYQIIPIVIEPPPQEEQPPANPELDAALEQNARLTEELARERTTMTQLRSILRQAEIPPPPPEHLQLRVVGEYIDRFVTSGTRSVTEFVAALKGVGVNVADCHRILDFGVGCGRVLRRFAETYPHAGFVGVDIDAEAIAWLDANYSPRFGQFAAAPHRPPLDMAGDQFDLIYAISVFTHLDEEMQFAWLSELHRLAKPGGHLLLTVHGANYIPLFPEEIQQQFREKEIFYNQDATPTDGLPDFYKNTYHGRAYVEREWARYFDILAYLPMGNENHQDLIVCRKRATPSSAE